jgi:hypothetical protein
MEHASLKDASGNRSQCSDQEVKTIPEKKGKKKKGSAKKSK